MIKSPRSVLWGQLIALTVGLCSAPLSALAREGDGRSLAQASRSKALESQARHIEELWAEWSELMREYTQHQIDHKQAPQEEVGWVSWFLGREGERTTRIRELSAELLSHLKGSEAQALKEKYYTLRDSIEAARLESVKLAEDSYLAPEEGEAWFYENSKEDYKELIKRKTAAIQAMRTEQASLIQSCHDSLVAMGVELTEAQIQQLFKMKSGGATLDLLITFAHLNLLLELLSERLADQGQGQAYAEAADRYYSVYVALIGLSLDLHRETRRRLREGDLKEINEMGQQLSSMIKQTQATMIQEAKRTDQSSTADIVRGYSENLKVQREILSDTKEYAGLLREQLGKIKVTEQKLERQWELALNTYKTVQLSRKYHTIVNRGLRDLNNLRKLDLPSMVPLMSERLSGRIQRLDEYRGKAIDLRPQR